ncbi:hypothetical protein AGOR_G00225620 [Albula goreensis]|uniref:Peripheral myelin protein 22 n=1 Tax=Albula goreensis TaxID=1534307 RepID=A0A8T3CK88_9TELE|nr:hypothetical protein AGOR_G00225620 [Albula goreensis]
MQKRICAILFLHIAVLALLLVSTIVNAWTVGESRSSYLWFHCHTPNGGSFCKPVPTGGWIQAVQGIMVLSVLYCILSLFFFLCQLFYLQKGGRFFFTGIFQIISSLLVLSAAVIYTVQSEYWVNEEEEEGFGFSYMLAWVAFPLALLSGLIYIFMRKVE